MVCLCGSTRFKDQFRVAELRESLRGRVVLSLPAFSQADGISFSDDEVAVLAELHQRKIELADEILVIDVDGYIGEQTQIEVAFAVSRGKRVRYLSKESGTSRETSDATA